MIWVRFCLQDNRGPLREKKLTTLSKRKMQKQRAYFDKERPDLIKSAIWLNDDSKKAYKYMCLKKSEKHC